MRRGFAAAILFLASAAHAQQPDPAQAFAKEWTTLQAADTLAAASHEHVAGLAQKLIEAYAADHKALTEGKAELDYWHRWCGDRPGCAQPVQTE